jgi:cytochrome c biogenesis protein CcdA
VGQQSKTRPLFIALGFVITFSLAGLFLSVLVSSFMIAPDTLRNFAVGLLAIFGLLLVWQTPFKKLTLHLSGAVTNASGVAQKAGSGNFGGFVLGALLGVIWTPCAGPVLGSILTLVATQTDQIRASILIFGYALGAGIPMLLIAYGGQYITTKVRFLANYTEVLQKVFGVLILSLAIAMFFQYDLLLQAKLLELFPAWNLAGIIKL